MNRRPNCIQKKDWLQHRSISCHIKQIQGRQWMSSLKLKRISLCKGTCKYQHKKILPLLRFWYCLRHLNQILHMSTNLLGLQSYDPTLLSNWRCFDSLQLIYQSQLFRKQLRQGMIMITQILIFISFYNYMYKYPLYNYHSIDFL